MEIPLTAFTFHFCSSEIMLRVGLTGGIASGKTTISHLFAKLGVMVIDTDVISHDLMQPGQSAYNQAVEYFGSEILNPDETINRPLLRKIVFKQPAQKKWLEEMIHPLIQRDTLSAIDNCTGQYVIIVIPLLFESDFKQLVDTVIAIDCPTSVQKTRLMLRDGTDEDLAERMIGAQLSNDERIALADQTIINGSEISRAHEVLNIHKELLKLADL